MVDYTAGDWREQVKNATGGKGVDAVYDPVGGALAETALRLLAPGGRYLVVGFVTGIAKIPLNLPLLKRCSIHGVNWGGSVMADPSVVPPVIKHAGRMDAGRENRPGADQRSCAGTSGRRSMRFFRAESRSVVS